LRVTELYGEGLPSDDMAAYLYRVVCLASIEQGRQVGRARRIDLMIAAVALANDRVLATRHPDDFAGLGQV
jgi:predicted nucleic acid-binding protein